MGCKPSKEGTTSAVDPALRVVAPVSPSSDPHRKRRAGVSAQAITAQQMSDWKRPVHEKSDESKALLRKIISTNNKLQVLFGHLAEDQLEQVILAMFPRNTLVGERVIRQRDNGDAFWIVESGQFDIFVKRGKQPLLLDSSDVGDKVATCGPGACFGELALMYNAPRSATVIGTQPGVLWGLDAQSFKMMLVTNENTKKKKYESFLGKVAILYELNAYELSNLSDVIDVASFGPNEVIMKQGDPGNRFFILESGEAKAFISTDGQPEVLVKTYVSPGEYFGELALILATPRQATINAGEKGCVLLYVSKDKFDRVLGPIKHRLKVENYPQHAHIIETAKAMNCDHQDDEETSPVSGNSRASEN